MSSETAGGPGLGLCTVCVRDVESKVGWKSGRWVSWSCLFLHSFIDSAVVFHAPVSDGQNCILKAAGGYWLCTAALVRRYRPSPGIAQILFGFSGPPQSSLALRVHRWPLQSFHGRWCLAEMSASFRAGLTSCTVWSPHGNVVCTP